MAYTETYINNDLSKLNTVLDTLVTNGIVGAVDYDTSGTYPIFKLYADAEKTTEVFRIEQTGGYSSGRCYKFKATAADGNYLDSTLAHAETSGHGLCGYRIMYGYSCENGVFVTFNPLATAEEGTMAYCYACVIITKNQADKPVFVWINSSATSFTENQIKTNMNTEYIIASNDKAPLTTLSRTAPATRTQTVLSPFFSCSESGNASYTPYAGRILAGGLASLVTNPRLVEITLNNKTYVTNGYWALQVD